jgi:hypothetical protein
MVCPKEFHEECTKKIPTLFTLRKPYAPKGLLSRPTPVLVGYQKKILESINYPAGIFI